MESEYGRYSRTLLTPVIYLRNSTDRILRADCQLRSHQRPPALTLLQAPADVHLLLQGQHHPLALLPRAPPGSRLGGHEEGARPSQGVAPGQGLAAFLPLPPPPSPAGADEGQHKSGPLLGSSLKLQQLPNPLCRGTSVSHPGRSHGWTSGLLCRDGGSDSPQTWTGE